MMSTRRISVPAGGVGNPLTERWCAGMSLQLAGRLAEEMMVVGGIGVEVRAARLDDRLPQQPELQ